MLPLVLGAVLVAGCVSPPPAPGAQSDLAPGSRACPEAGPTRPFEHAGLQEASGIARSQREPCLFWVHNDSDAGPVLYATDGAGHRVGEAWLDGAAVDWEDIASFTLHGTPYLLVADTGNNALDRGAVAFLVLAEPALPPSGAPVNLTVSDVITITVRYPAAPFDIESVAVDPQEDAVLVVSKGVLAVAPADPSGPNQALYRASLSEALAGRDVTLAFETIVPGIRPGPGDDPMAEYAYGVGGGRVTGMDLRPDRGAVALLTYREVLIWKRAPAQAWAAALGGMPTALAVPAPGKDQMEGLTWSSDGALLLVADERGKTNSELTVIVTGVA